MRGSSLFQPLVSIFSALALLVAIAAPAPAAPLTSLQANCVNTMNKSGQKVAATQGKEHSSCIKLAGAGKLIGMDADQCVVADSKGKVGNAELKTTDGQASKCMFPFPPYGYTDDSIVNTAAKGEELSLLEDIFSFPLDPIIATSNPAAGCQAAVSKTYEKFAATYVKEYNSCKKTRLQRQRDLSATPQMEACMGQDPKGKIGKASAKILDGLTKKCVGVNLATAFPGDCVGDGRQQQHVCRLRRARFGLPHVPRDQRDGRHLARLRQPRRRRPERDLPTVRQRRDRGPRAV